MKPSRHILLSALLLINTASVIADDRLDLEGATITGNRELPKVLYVVPWKAPQAAKVSAEPFSASSHEKLSPLDRDLFRLEINVKALPGASSLAPARQ